MADKATIEYASVTTNSGNHGSPNRIKEKAFSWPYECVGDPGEPSLDVRRDFLDAVSSRCRIDDCDRFHPGFREFSFSTRWMIIRSAKEGATAESQVR